MTVSPRWIWTLLCAAAFVWSAGCGGDTQEPVAQPESPPTPMPAVEPPAPAPAPSAEGKSSELPDHFPSDVPLHPSSRVTVARVAPDQSMAVSFEVEGADVEGVGGHYADSLAAEGWTTTLHDDPNGKMIFALKSNRNVTIVVHPGNGVTLVDIVVAELP